MSAAGTPARVAASGQWWDAMAGARQPAGEVHAWEPGRNETRCGLALSRSSLVRFPHVSFPDTFPESGGAADAVTHVCPRCVAAVGVRRSGRSWTRSNPRP